MANNLIGTSEPIKAVKRKERTDMPRRLWMYHKEKCPRGQIFSSIQLPQLAKEGWVDGPDKFIETPSPRPELKDDVKKKKIFTR